jgi:hypothetical protein
MGRDKMKLIRGALVFVVAMFVSIAGHTAALGDTPLQSQLAGHVTGSASSKNVAQALIAPTNFYLANSLPFGANGDGVYQQVYSSSLFSGPIKITGLSFFIGEYTVPPNVGFVSGTYAVSLSTTSVAVGALDPNNMGANLGDDDKTVFSGSLNGGMTIDVKPFNYNPSQGNLLLTIEITNGSSGVPGGNFWRAAFDTGTSRAYNFPWGGGADNIGLTTLFTFVPNSKPH